MLPSSGTVVLACDTSSPIMTAVLLVDGVIVAQEQEKVRAQHILAVIDRLLVSAGKTLDDVTHLAVGTGPGGFTGLRVGISTMRGLAAARNLPLAAVWTLHAVANSYTGTADEICVSVDALRGERFMRHYTRAIEGAHSWIPSESTRTIPAQEELVHAATAEVVRDLTADGLAQIVLTAAYDTPTFVTPEYGRDPDAVPANNHVFAQGDVPAWRAEGMGETTLVTIVTDDDWEPLQHVEECDDQIADELWALEQRVHAVTWAEQSFREEVQHPNAVLWIHRGDKVIEGYVLIRRIGDSYELLSIAVDPESRRRGIASVLAHVATAAIHENDPLPVRLEVRAKNEAAIALYTNVGFVIDGTRPRYYGDDDAITMVKMP